MVGVGGVTDAGMLLVMLLDIEAVICGNAVKLSGSWSETIIDKCIESCMYHMWVLEAYCIYDSSIKSYSGTYLFDYVEGNPTQFL